MFQPFRSFCTSSCGAIPAQVMDIPSVLPQTEPPGDSRIVNKSVDDSLGPRNKNVHRNMIFNGYRIMTAWIFQ
jgi:hypothetical protein